MENAEVEELLKEAALYHVSEATVEKTITAIHRLRCPATKSGTHGQMKHNGRCEFCSVDLMVDARGKLLSPEELAKIGGGGW